MSSSSRKFVGSVKLHAAFAAGLFALGANADGIVDEIKPDDALEFEARQTENGYLYVDESDQTNVVEIFLSSGTWTIPAGVTAFDYFVVGGGGSGGSRWGGGGGAGGVIVGTVSSVKGFVSRELSITVGAGGTPVMGQKVGKAGSPSEIVATLGSGEVSLVKALGGGAGWRSNTDITTDYNNDGGSGGGGSYSNLAGGKANAGSFYSADWITGEMFASEGGFCDNNMDRKSGGGGGAGAPGAAVADGGAGGDGIETFITGKSAWFAGGGGGASGNGNAVTIGGKGGGGAGSGIVSAFAGTQNTGSGGGGLGENGVNRYSGAGGSGIVIIRHLAVPGRTGPVPQYELTVKATNGGVVSGPGTGSYDEGSIVVLVAEPESNYEFRSWAVNGVPVGRTPRLDLEMSSDMTVVAKFDELLEACEWGWYDARDGKTAVVAFTNENMGAISWTLPEGVKAFDYVVVGGGGSGGSRWGGGGGAGGVITGMVSLVEGFVSRELSITVGAGGAPVTGQSVGNAGSPSEIVATVGSEEVSLVQALGGGAGWKSNITFTPDFNNDGGSGGGGSYSNLVGGKANAGSVYSAGWITGEMFAKEGGLGSNEMDYKGGGGGGAGKAGARFDMDAAGGDGIETFITGKSLWLAGGGAGANGKGTADTAPGGKGGGGASAGCKAAGSAVPNTGSGGGGVGQEGSYYSGAGGSGIVILRYALPSRGLIFIIK